MKLEKISTSFIVAILVATLGVCFITLNRDFLSKIYFTAISLAIIGTGIVKISFADRDRVNLIAFRLDLIEGSINLIVGAVFVNFWEYLSVDIFLFFAYIAIPITRLFFAKKLLNQFFIDIIKYYFAITILCSTNYTVYIYFPIIGAVHIAFSVFLLIIKYVRYRKKKGIINNEIENK